MRKRPNSMRNLDAAIRRVCGNSPKGYLETRTLMANAIVASMLPDGVVKGGTAIKMRLGSTATRFTTDLDTATAMDTTEYAKRLDAALREGWEGFSGAVVPRDPAHPKGVPNEYVMQPYDVKLSYLGKPWCTVPLEVGFNEIGDADNADWIEADDVSEIFEAVGLPAPGPAPLMILEHQVAQKLHAVTDGNRPRDLIDLQLITEDVSIDLALVRRICVRLFAYRQQQAWPPKLMKREGWGELYATDSEGLKVLATVDEAVEWANELIAKIDTSS